MGLLDQIVGGLTGQGSAAQTRPAGAGTGDMKRIITALLPVVLAMLANRQGGASPAGASPGLGGLLGSLGGLAGGGLGGLGGLPGLLEQFSQKGYGAQASSWVGTGPNQPLAPQAIPEVLGPERLSQIASQAGVTEDEAQAGLAQLIPQLVDRVTPAGQLPAQEQLLGSLSGYLRELQR